MAASELVMNGCRLQSFTPPRIPITRLLFEQCCVVYCSLYQNVCHVLFLENDPESTETFREVTRPTHVQADRGKPNEQPAMIMGRLWYRL